MSTKKRRIATYIPTEIEDKFQAFKREREIGDSQALILILTEFLGVSQQVAHSSNSLENVKNELLTELKSELLKETERLEDKLIGKISELLSELLPEIKLEATDNACDQQELSIPVIEVTDSNAYQEKGLKGIELAKRFNYDDSVLGRKARESTEQEFADWSKRKDPEGIAWKRRKDKKYYPVNTGEIKS
jgi:hypothetical protein